MMVIDRVVVGPLQTNCYIVMCPETKEAVIIDPGDEASRIAAVVNYHKAQVKALLVTHGHFDHLMAVGELKERLNAPFWLPQLDWDIAKHASQQATFFGFVASPVPEPDESVEDGQEIPVGSLKIKVLATPGHTPGHVSFLIEEHLFCGDVLFAGGIGRTDLPGGSHEQLMQTLRERILTLPASTTVHPGHGPDTIIGEEKLTNPFLRGL